MFAKNYDDDDSNIDYYYDDVTSKRCDERFFFYKKGNKHLFSSITRLSHAKLGKIKWVLTMSSSHSDSGMIGFLGLRAGIMPMLVKEKIWLRKNRPVLTVRQWKARACTQYTLRQGWGFRPRRSILYLTMPWYRGKKDEEAISNGVCIDHTHHLIFFWRLSLRFPPSHVFHPRQENRQGMFLLFFGLTSLWWMLEKIVFSL